MNARDPDGIIFVDIETTGLSRARDLITTMTWLWNGQWYVWKQGDDSSEFLNHWKTSACLCTYNGRCFDEAFICKEFDTPKHPNHLDLRYFLARRGIKGGLKRISLNAGFKEPPILGQINGLMAVDLWRQVTSGEHRALNTLICYNALDVARTAFLFNNAVARLSIPRIPWSYDSDWAIQWLSTQNAYSDQEDAYPQRRDYEARNVFEQKASEQPINSAGEWHGSVICFTGKMSDSCDHPMLRKDARLVANNYGFAWVDEVVIGCTHLVAAEGTTDTNKSKRARQLGISIITPSQFWEMLQ